jgi:sugar lactone lactonase YvrE
VAVDADSNVYIADRGHHRIRKLTKTGTEYIITTIAGTGEEGDEDGDGDIGDGGPATAAQLNGPRGVTVGDDDYIYIADTGNNRIHQIGPDGVITTIAGAEDGGDGPAMSPQLSVPRGVAVDAGGNLYIADTGNNQIHKLDDEGIVTVAGAGGLGDEGPATNARLLEPTGLAIDVDGTIYITDSGNNRVRKVDVEGTITTLAGTGEEGDGGDGGPATEAQLYYPIGVAIDSEGNVYISDTFNNRIRKVDSEGIITTFAGSGGYNYRGEEDGIPATEARLNWPTGVAVGPNSHVYIADSYNNLIRKVDSEGIITTIAGTGEDFRFLRRTRRRRCRRWRAGDECATRLAYRRGRGRRQQRLYRGQGPSPHPQADQDGY